MTCHNVFVVCCNRGYSRRLLSHACRSVFTLLIRSMLIVLVGGGGSQDFTLVEPQMLSAEGARIEAPKRLGLGRGCLDCLAELIV